MNKIWIFLITISTLSLIFIDPSLVLSGLTTGANKAVKLSFELLAIYAVWVGIFNILELTGISKLLTKILSPIIDLIFGKKNLSPKAKQYVSMNISANMLGMGGAATPMGIKAIESMNEDNKSGNVTYPMTMLIILSCTSLQLLPTSIIGIMTNAGSSSASSIIVPSLIAGLASTIVGILLVKVYHKLTSRANRRKNG